MTQTQIYKSWRFRLIEFIIRKVGKLTGGDHSLFAVQILATPKEDKVNVSVTVSFTDTTGIPPVHAKSMADMIVQAAVVTSEGPVGKLLETMAPCKHQQPENTYPGHWVN